MNFRKHYSTGSYIHPSKLSKGDENQYATWKKQGLKRKVTEWILGKNTQRYKRLITENRNA